VKVVNSIRMIYQQRFSIYRALKNEVDTYFNSNKESNWHYESRIKELESFALKAETSRFNKISVLEDFFAATIVVDQQSSIPTAIELAKKKFSIDKQRPKDLQLTHKKPSSFVFDDLRLYLKLPEKESRPPKPYTNVIFELQIKTFLQHAWSIATHDMVYKGNEVNWAQSRIAHQVKAMLEHAELSISEAKQLASNPIVNKVNSDVEVLQSILTIVKATWAAEKLPKDLVRLAENIKSILDISEEDASNLENIFKTSRFINSSPMENISPYTAIVLSLIERDEDTLIQKLSTKRKKLFLPDEALNLLSKEHREKISGIVIKAE
jgi:ppGpp synthetase/RelA/SpoT-type nucleotidyltranferase